MVDIEDIIKKIEDANEEEETDKDTEGIMEEFKKVKERITRCFSWERLVYWVIWTILSAISLPFILNFFFPVIISTFFQAVYGLMISLFAGWFEPEISRVIGRVLIFFLYIFVWLFIIYFIYRKTIECGRTRYSF